jgi:hypothetical protein
VFAKRYLLFISLLLLIVCTFPLISCMKQENAKQSLYIYLTNTAESTVTILEDEYTHYLTESSRKDIYEQQLAKLQEPQFLNSPDFYYEMVYLGGYWVSDGEHMINTHWFSYKRDASGEIHVDFTDMLTESFITEIYNKLKDIEKLSIDVKWANICEQEQQQISLKLEILEELLAKWDISYKNWHSSEIGENTMSISGQDLGIHSNSPCVGEWYYYTDKEEFEPADSYATNLLVILEKIPTYEQKKEMSDISIPKYKLEPANYSWYSYRSYYNLPESAPLKITCSRESETTQNLFQQYPKLEEYWDMLKEMGFTVSCTIVDEGNGYEGEYNILMSVVP